MAKSHTTIDVYSQDDSETLNSPSSNSMPRRAVTRMDTLDKNAHAGEPEPWLSGSPYRHPVPDDGDSWGKCFKKVKTYDDDMCDGWRGEVDNLIVFAGLFSAAVTTFVIESYQALQEDPNDRNTWLLEQILIQAHNANTPNASVTAPLASPPVFTPSATDIRVNVFWFLSLSLSLATVFVGILCMQWLREYQRDSPLDPQEAISLRQIRYEGLMAWKVPDILMSLPILLHASLTLFFAGLIDLLWSINHAVAISVSVVAGMVLFFLLGTTLLPTIQLYFITDNQLRKPQCAYKSPQSWAFHRIITGLVKLTNPGRSIYKASFRVVRYKPFFEDKNWVDHDKRWLEARNKPHTPQGNGDIVHGLTWIDKHLGQTTDMAFAMYHCIKNLPSAASTQVVSSISERIQHYLSPGKMAEHLQFTTEDERKETNATLFLEINKEAFPQLDQYQLESVVRILNTRLQNTTDEDNVQIRDSLPFLRWPLHYIRGLPGDLITQFLLCVKKLVARGHMKDDYEEQIWDLIQLILSSRDTHSSRHSHVKLAFEIMAAFEDKLRTTDSTSAKEEVKGCANHIIKALPPGNLHDLVPHAKPVLGALRTRMNSVGGPNDILSTEYQARWADITQRVSLDDVSKPTSPT